jgi:hypothetical protein
MVVYAYYADFHLLVAPIQAIDSLDGLISSEPGFPLNGQADLAPDG